MSLDGGGTTGGTGGCSGSGSGCGSGVETRIGSPQSINSTLPKAPKHSGTDFPEIGTRFVLPHLTPTQKHFVRAYIDWSVATLGSMRSGRLDPRVKKLSSAKTFANVRKQVAQAAASRAGTWKRIVQRIGQVGTMGTASLNSLADEIDGIRSSLLADANATYLDRPVFGGVTSGASAYDSSGSYVGTTGNVTRRIADGVTVNVNVDGTAVFGDGSTSVFQELSDLSDALRAGDNTGISAGVSAMQARIDTITSARTSAGVVYQQVSNAGDAASGAQLQLKSNLSTIEDVDLAQATIQLQTQQVAYQASLAATAKTIQPSLLDFLK